MPSVKNPIFGNTAIFDFLHYFLSSASKILVGTVQDNKQH
jgi:hypothetical protein